MGRVNVSSFFATGEAKWPLASQLIFLGEREKLGRIYIKINRNFLTFIDYLPHLAYQAEVLVHKLDRETNHLYRGLAIVHHPTCDMSRLKGWA